MNQFKRYPVLTPWMKWRKIYTAPFDQRILIAEPLKDGTEVRALASHQRGSIWIPF